MDETIINIFYRSGYAMAIAFYPPMAWLVMERWIPLIQEWSYPNLRVGQWFIFGSAAVVLVVVLAGFVFVVQRQSQYSEMVTPQSAEALVMLREHDPGVGVATNFFSLSLWVAGLNKVHSPFAFNDGTDGPPPAYVDDDANLRCIMNWVEVCDPVASADELGIGYLLVEERFPFYNERASGNYLAPPDQWQRTAEAEWLTLIYSEGTTRLWRIEQ